MHPWQNTLLKIFNFCFLIATSLVVILSIIFISGNANLKHANRILMAIIISSVILIGIKLIFTTFRFFNSKSKTWNQRMQFINSILILIIAFVVAATVQMSSQLADGYGCLHIAKQLSHSMNWSSLSQGSNHELGYFYPLLRCANMAPLIYIQAIAFKFFTFFNIKLSITNMIAIGTYLNTILLLASLYFVYLMLKKHCRPATVTGFSFLSLINIPLYATVYYVYTDLPSLFAVTIILYSYDSLLSHPIKIKRNLYLLAIIISSIIGSLFKFNVLIATIAILIHYCLTHSGRKFLKMAMVILIPIFIGISGTKAIIFYTSPVPSNKIGLPAINWVNMSFNDPKNDGGFDEKYFTHTFKIKQEVKTTKKTGQIETKEFIRDFIKNLGYYFHIIYLKIGTTYGQGTYDFNSFFRSDLVANKYLKKLPLGQLLYGKLAKIYLYSSFILQLAMFSIMGLGIFSMLRKRIISSTMSP